MEKSKPHCPLAIVRQLVAESKIRMTASAINGAEALGLGRDEIIDAVKNLTMADFYKSMTAHADHAIWQDVYRPTTKAGEVYLKLIVIDDVLVVSFKEL